ncbi:MAG: hypothetical protein P8L18_12150 [Verrucomicrobiota bacterium]|nr:hypothetical protein [Verrucomicrobiota bacterium]
MRLSDFLILSLLGLLVFQGGLSTVVAASAADPLDVSLTADQILQRMRKAMDTADSGKQVQTFLRKTVVTDLKADGEIRKRTYKTYRAYTDGRDQQLLEINGQPASTRDIAKDRAHNLERQQRYLHRQDREKSSQNSRLMAKNMDLFRRKFIARRMGNEMLDGRPAYTIGFSPDSTYELENGFVDRLMNAVHGKVWVDTKEHHIARMEMKLNRSVSFLGGLAGVLREIRIDIHQKQLAPNLWVDEKITAYFDVRVLFKSYLFRLSSRAVDFEAVVSKHGP